MPIIASMTLFLEDAAGSYGWSETYFQNATDITAAQIEAGVLAGKRQDILSDRHYLIAARVSDVVVFNDSLLVTGLPLQGSIVTAGPGDVEEPWSCLNARVEGGAAHRGRKYLHGNVEAIYLANRGYDVANPNAAAFNAFAAYLILKCLLKYKVAGVDNYIAINNVLYRRQTERKVGRPFDLLHGRRPT